MNASKQIAMLLSTFVLTAGGAFGGDNPGNPERYFEPGPPPQQANASELRAELDAYRRNPVSPDGWVDVGGEHGAMQPTAMYAVVDGKLTLVSNIVGSVRPERTLTAGR